MLSPGSVSRNSTDDYIKSTVKEDSLTIIYTSTRGLTYFAIGLMKETLQFFKVKGTIDMVENYNNDGSVKFHIQLH